MQWKVPLQIPDSIEILYILEGKLLSDYIKGQPVDYLKLVNSIPEAAANLYKIKCDDFVFTIKDYNLLQSSEIVELLKPILCKCEDVVTIQTKPLPEYQTENPSTHTMVIRQITTTASNKFKKLGFNYENLEQPNILSGISAGGTFLIFTMSKIYL